jgi:hypothetical protein
MAKFLKMFGIKMAYERKSWKREIGGRQIREQVKGREIKKILIGRYLRSFQVGEK